MTPEEARKILRLKDWTDCELADGSSVCRMDDEFKISPHGAEQPDLECYWLDRAEVLALAKGG